jgi:hypothetical protein
MTLVIVIHSIYKNTFGWESVKFSLPMIAFFLYLIFKKDKNQ